MGENHQTDTSRIQLYNIVITPSSDQSTYDMNDVSAEEDFHDANSTNTRIRRQSRRIHEHRRLLNVSEATRNKLANASCFCGIFLSAIGGGLVLMFLVADYSPSLQVVINDYQNLIIPGFVLLFMGKLFYI